MSKIKKARRQIIMSDSLKDKLDSNVPEAKESIYYAVADTEKDFLDVVDESLELESQLGKRQSRIPWSLILGILLIGVFIVLFIGGYMLLKQVI